MRIVRLRATALEDLAGIRDFYDDQSPGLGDEAVEDLLQVSRQLARHGGIHLFRKGLYRMVADGRFPHHVFYYSIEENEVHVRAIIDHRRDPKYIRRRLRHV